MRHIFLITRNFMKLTFTNVSRYILFFVLPVIIFIGAIMLFGGSQNRGFIIGYVNSDQGNIGKDLIARLSETKKNTLIAMNPSKINSEIIEGKIDLAMVLTENFTRSFDSPKAPSVKIISLDGDSALTFMTEPVNKFIAQVLKLKKINQNNDTLFSKMYQELNQGLYSLETEEVSDKQLSRDVIARSFGFFLFLIMLQASIITALMLLDKKEKTYFRIRMTPLHEIYYTLGNMLASFIILVAQILLTLFILVFILKIELMIPLGSLVSLLLAYTLASIGIGLVICSFAKNPTQANLFASLVLQPTFFLSGCFIPRQALPEILRKISTIFPQSWAISGIEALQQGAGFKDLTLHILILLGFAALFVSLFALKMKNDEDRAA